MSFAFNVSVTACLGDKELPLRGEDSLNDKYAEAKHETQSSVPQPGEKKQQIESVMANQDSLHSLETATAGHTKKARQLDLQSLAILMAATDRVERQKGIKSATRRAPQVFPIHAPVNLIDNAKEQPLSSPPLRAPDCAQEDDPGYTADNEDLGFLGKLGAFSKAAAAVAKDITWETVKTKLAAAGCASSSIEQVADTADAHEGRQAHKLQYCLNKLDEKDAKEAWVRVEKDMAESVELSAGSSKPNRHRPMRDAPRRHSRRHHEVSDDELEDLVISRHFFPPKAKCSVPKEGEEEDDGWDGTDDFFEKVYALPLDPEPTGSGSESSRFERYGPSDGED